MLTIATFNTHFGVDRQGRPFDVVGAIAGLDADVVALQEVWQPRGGRSFAAHAADRLGYELHETPLVPGCPVHRKDLARRREPAVGTWVLALLSRHPGRPLPTVDLRRRVAMPVDVDVPGEGTLRVVVTHIFHHLYGSPLQIRRVARALDAGGPAAVALGDFNLWGPPVSMLFGAGWSRPVRGRTWPAWRPHSQLDHIVCNAAVTASDGEVLAATPSDHRPIRARLAF